MSEYIKLRQLVNEGFSNVEISHKLKRATYSVASKIHKVGLRA